MTAAPAVPSRARGVLRACLDLPEAVSRSGRSTSAALKAYRTRLLSTDENLGREASRTFPTRGAYSLVHQLLGRLDTSERAA